MKKKLLKIAGIITLLGGLYLVPNCINHVRSNKSINPNSIVMSIDNKYKIGEKFQKITETVDSLKKDMVFQFKESEISKKITETVGSLEKRIRFKLKRDNIENPTAYSNEKTLAPKMNPLFFHGKSLDDYFKEFDELMPEQQEHLVKSLNNLSVWDLVLLSRYVPIDGILRELSSFYSIDYKWHLQSLFSESILEPMAIGPTNDKGLGQITPPSEKWARELYNKEGYRFPGPEITNDIFDPYTNLVLSSIIFRKSAEENILDLDALYSIYTNGYKGVDKNEEGLYVVNDFGLNDIIRAKNFNHVADRLITFSWISMERPDLGEHIVDDNLRNMVKTNNNTYDAKIAYGDMSSFLNSLSDKEKYSETNLRIFRNETINISNWLKNLYNSVADSHFY